MFNSPTSTGFYFNQVQQILIVVSFVIFAILLLVQVYGFFINMHIKEEEADL